ncbi:glycoside hydrolase family 3 N-terminal domain-containing protein [Maribacter sp. CXY002]|uniref:glycoside hydrolase family 3 protein n=1 Tax=Maribacter luteocoastalis TaxID=3407671 RepID=UPI003B6758D4
MQNIKSLSVRFLLGLMILGLTVWSCKEATVPTSTQSKQQPLLGYRSATILTMEGLQFKDLNRNGLLDDYEDWRLTDEERSNDLVSKMTLEQKAGFMLISTTRLENDWSFDTPQSEGPITSGFNETDMVRSVNMFTRKPLDYPMIFAAGTTKAVTQFHERHFILRANTTPRILAEWSNNLQALCESDGLGIPAIIASNPRNHITIDASIGLSVGKTPFSVWPGELGLAAMRDSVLVREFADIARQEWLATGIRKGYMYMADLATEPRWQRVEGTFGEDAELASQMIRDVVLGFQRERLGPTSIALTTKHFPGGGATEGGQDPHFDWGKREVFPGGMFENNLIPFKAAIAAGTSAIMPYYSFPVGTKYEQVAYAYNKPILQDVLRGELGFDGIINSDTGPIHMMPWGVEQLSVIERYKKAVEAGVNIFSGTADPTQLIETLKNNPDLHENVNISVQKLLLEKFRLGLFENPYTDVDMAEKIVGKKQFQEKADVAMRKSIVLLRNEDNGETKSLPIRSKTKVYFETYYPKKGAKSSNIYAPEANDWDIDIVDNPDKADVIVVWVIPKSPSLFESDGSPLHVSLSKNNVDIDYINRLSSKKPTVLVVNYSNPWAIDEVYNQSSSTIKAVLATFGTTPEAILDVLTGKFTPSAKMPFSTPVSDQAAQTQKSDVPGYMEGEGYALFNFHEGLSY